jgi:hypothetical protein
VFTPVPDYQGVVRLKADVLQQVNRLHFEAYGRRSTSQMGVPKYWFQSGNSFTDTVAARRPMACPIWIRGPKGRGRP